MAARLFWRLWWLLLIPAAAVAYGLMADWRWIVVGLIVTLIVYPMVMTLAVVRYAGSERIMRRAGTRAIREDDDGELTLLDESGAEIERIARPAATDYAPEGMIYRKSNGLIIIELGREADDLLVCREALKPDIPE